MSKSSDAHTKLDRLGDALAKELDTLSDDELFEGRAATDERTTEDGKPHEEPRKKAGDQEPEQEGELRPFHNQAIKQLHYLFLPE